MFSENESTIVKLIDLNLGRSISEMFFVTLIWFIFVSSTIKGYAFDHVTIDKYLFSLFMT